MTDNDDSQPVTVVISRRVRKGNETAFEHLSTKMTEVASGFPGHLGAVLFRPQSPDDPEYRVVFKFDTQAHLDNWFNSEERRDWLTAIESLLEKPSDIETTSGLVTWFTLPGRNPVPPPAKYKMAVVSWIGLFPLVSAIFWFLGPYLEAVPFFLRIAMTTAVIMVLMTWIVMPRLTRMFAFWLFPQHGKNIR